MTDFSSDLSSLIFCEQFPSAVTILSTRAWHSARITFDRTWSEENCPCFGCSRHNTWTGLWSDIRLGMTAILILILLWLLPRWMTLSIFERILFCRYTRCRNHWRLWMQLFQAYCWKMKSFSLCPLFFSFSSANKKGFLAFSRSLKNGDPPARSGRASHVGDHIFTPLALISQQSFLFCHPWSLGLQLPPGQQSHCLGWQRFYHLIQIFQWEHAFGKSFTPADSI